jgi:hypothetical protein
VLLLLRLDAALGSARRVLDVVLIELSVADNI